MTIKVNVAAIRQRLKDVSDAPDLDAAWLLLHVLGTKDATWLVTHGDEPLSEDLALQLESFVARRQTGYPLAYTLGEWEFYGRSLYVDERVLIPRPTTEDLIEKALPVIQTMRQQKNRPLVIADIGTGSGCIAITLALELGPDVIAKIYATDISIEALEVASRNAERHHVSDQITCIQGDMLQPLHDTKIDFIVSNPPYVPTAEVAQAGRALETKGLLFEPHQALDGGKKGTTYTDILLHSGIPSVIETEGGRIISSSSSY